MESIRSNGVQVTDARTLPAGCPAWKSSGPEQLATVYESRTKSGQWISLTIDPMAAPCNVGPFAVAVEVGHPECEDSAASLTVYAYEFPEARRRIASFLRAVIVKGGDR